MPGRRRSDEGEERSVDTVVEPAREESLRREFDASAPGYRAAVEGNPFERYLKARALAELLPRLAGRDPLLEIGPGPGLETIPLARAGHRVTAVDLSGEMQRVLRERVAAEGLSDRVAVRSGGLATLADDLSDVAPGHYAGAWSTFGAPNLTPDPTAVARGLARLLGPGAPALVGLLNRWGIAPLLYEAGQGNWRAIRARQRQPIRAEGIRYPLDLYVWTPREYARAWAPYFVLHEVVPLSALAPPFASPRLLERFGRRAWSLARRVDRRLTPALPALSEWVLLELRRTDVPLPGGR